MGVDASQKVVSNLLLIMNKFYSDVVQDEGQKGQIFAEAEQMIDERMPSFKERRPIPFVGLLNGVRTSMPIDTLMARFGEGGDSKWVALCWFHGGWVRALQPLTRETKISMPWLDHAVNEAIKKELGV